MGNHKMIFGLVVFYAAAVFIAGCIPEDSLQWSEDGSVGVMSYEGALYLVDGQNGDLTEIAKENVLLWADISKDGEFITYSQGVNCSDLSEGLKHLPPEQVKIITDYAGLLREEIIKHGSTSGDIPELESERFEYPEGLQEWVFRYLCEKADEELVEKLSSDTLKEGKECELTYYNLTVVACNNPVDKKVVATSALPILQPRFSPNRQHIAHLLRMNAEQDSDDDWNLDLFLASPRQDIKAMHIAQNVSVGYDWSDDGRAIAYLESENKNTADEEFPVGTLTETIVIDANDNPIAEPISVSDHEGIGTHKCTGQTRELAGTVFNWFMKVEYGTGGRLFFSSTELSLPSSKKNEERWSVFCYDPVTSVVADILPTNVPESYVWLFSLSPDGDKLLLPMEEGGFGIYELDTRTITIPVAEEDIGNDANIIPAWKGNKEISCIVSSESKLLPQALKGKYDHEQMVVLGTDGKLRLILSENWPDELNTNSQENQ
jgi:hypothetical protein